MPAIQYPGPRLFAWMMEKDCPSQEANLRVPFASCVPDCLGRSSLPSTEVPGLHTRAGVISNVPYRIVSSHGPVGDPQLHRRLGVAYNVLQM